MHDWDVIRNYHSENLARPRGFSKERVTEFYEPLEKLVDKYNIDANTIFNVDESGYITFKKRMQKVIVKKDKRQVGGIISGERGVNTTLVCCTNAAAIYIHRDNF